MTYSSNSNDANHVVKWQKVSPRIWVWNEWRVVDCGSGFKSPWTISHAGNTINLAFETHQQACARAEAIIKMWTEMTESNKQPSSAHSPGNLMKVALITLQDHKNNGRRGRIMQAHSDGAYVILFPTVHEPEPRAEFYANTSWTPVV